MTYYQIIQALFTLYELLERIQRNGKLSAEDLERSIAARKQLRKALVELVNEDPTDLSEQVHDLLASTAQFEETPAGESDGPTVPSTTTEATTALPSSFDNGDEDEALQAEHDRQAADLDGPPVEFLEDAAREAGEIEDDEQF